MSVKKAFRKIQSYYHYCDYCGKKMNLAIGPEEPQTHDYTGRYMDENFINTGKSDIHMACLEKMLKAKS